MTSSYLLYSVVVGVLISKFPLNENTMTSFHLVISLALDALDCLGVQSCAVNFYGIEDLRVYSSARSLPPINIP